MKQSHWKYMSTIMLCVALIGSCAGCQMRKNITKDISKMDSSSATEPKEKSTNKVEDVQKTKKGALAQKLGADGMLELSPLADDGTTVYTVNADIDVSADAAPGVYEEHKVKTNVESVDILANRLFEGDKVVQVIPLNCYSISDLQKEKAVLLSKLKDENNEYYNGDKTRYLEVLMRLHEKQKPSEYKPHDYSYCKQNDDYTYIVEGYINGIRYQIASQYTKRDVESDGYNVIKIVNMQEGYYESDIAAEIDNISWSAYSDFNVTNEDTEPMDALSGEPRNIYVVDSKNTKPAVNECRYEEDEAESIARSFLEKIVKDPVTPGGHLYLTGSHADAFALKDLGEKSFDFTKGNPAQQGYIFDYYRQVDGLECGTYESERKDSDVDALVKENFQNSENASGFCGNEVYKVEITSRGVSNVVLPGIMFQCGDVVEEHVEMMNLAELKTLIEEYLVQGSNYKVKQNSDIKQYGMVEHIDLLKLSMMTLHYNGKYTLCPVWIVGYQSTDQDSEELIVNAIDGSLVVYSIAN